MKETNTLNNISSTRSVISDPTGNLYQYVDVIIKPQPKLGLHCSVKSILRCELRQIFFNKLLYKDRLTCYETDFYRVTERYKKIRSVHSKKTFTCLGWFVWGLCATLLALLLMFIVYAILLIVRPL